MQGRAEDPNFSGTERFIVQRRLGAGGMGVVFEAFDCERQTRVAVKVLRMLDDHSLYRFKNEFRSAADLRHPNLVRLGELHRQGDLWFFTMELVDGVSFLSYVSADDSTPSRDGATSDGDTLTGSRLVAHPQRRRFDEARLRRALGQLALGVAAIHASGKIHRDIKPSNVLVTPSGRAVLLDFGLVTEVVGGSQNTDVQVVGTAAYMAPEQGAGQALSTAADWYGVGAVLYHSLTGSPPFEGVGIDIVAAKQRLEPPPPRTRVPDIPSDLDALCSDLLRRDPRARPQGEDVLARLGVARSVVPAAAHAGSKSTFVGRKGELATLRAGFDEVRQGRGVTLFVHGESGIGKSALVRRFLDDLELADSGVVILSGRCYEREQLPYKAFDGIVDALSRYLSHIDPVVAARLLADDAALLARVFPVLRRVPAMSGVEEPRLKVQNPQEIRTRAFAALRQTLSRLGERRPLVLFVDDFQWADADSLALLVDVMHPPAPPPLFLVATLRSTSATVQLEGLADLRHLSIPRLDAEAARDLVHLLLPEAFGNAANADAITAEGAGHPMFIQELVRHALAKSDHGQTPGTLRLDEALWARIARLDPETRTVLEMVTIAGTPLPQRIIAKAIGLESASFASRVVQLQDEHLVRAGGARISDMVEPYHDRVREAVLAHLAADVRAQHHGRLAAALEQAGVSDRDPRALVRHLEGAGQKDRAAHQAQRAAQMAAEALAFEQAAELYGIVLRLGTLDEAEQCALKIRLADALVNAGRSSEAADLYLEAARGVDAGSRLECQRRAAEQLLLSGHIERGLTALQAVLGEFGVRLPSTPARALFSVLYQRFRLRLRGIRWKPRDEIEIPQRELTRLDIYRAVSVGLGMVDTIRGADFQARGLLLALRIGERRRVGRSLAAEATYLALQGRKSLPRARSMLEQADQIAKDSKDPYLVGWVNGSEGAVLYFEGKFRAAEARVAETEKLFLESTTGTTWEVNTMRIFRLWSLRLIGAARELRRWFDEYVRDASRRGDRYAETTLSRSCAVLWLMEDRPDRAREELAHSSWTPPEGGYHLQHYYQLRAWCEIDLYTGGSKETLSQTGGDFDEFRRSLLTRVQILRAEALWLQARLTIAATDHGPDDARRVGAVARAARLLDRERMPFTGVWSQLLQAAIACHEGDLDCAGVLLRDAARAAEEHDMLLCAAVARRRHGELIGGDEGVRLVAQADESMSELGLRAPTRMADLIAPGFAPQVSQRKIEGTQSSRLNKPSLPASSPR